MTQQAVETVYVVMGNDFPEAVFDNLPAAEAFCAEKRKEKNADGQPSRIYWRAWLFRLRSE